MLGFYFSGGVGNNENRGDRTQPARFQLDEEPEVLPGTDGHLQLYDLVARETSARRSCARSLL